MVDQLKFGCGYCLLDLTEDFTSILPNKVERCLRCGAYYIKVQANEDQLHDQVMAAVHEAARAVEIEAKNLQVVVRYGLAGIDDLPQASFWDKDEVLTTHEIAAVLNLSIDRVQLLLQQGSIEARMPVGDGWGARRWRVQKYRIIGGEE